MLEQSLAMPALCSILMSVAQQLKLTANLIGLYFYIQMCLLEVELWCKIGHFKRSRWIGLLVKPLLDKYEMASAPTQKHLSGLSEGGVEGFWYYNTYINITAEVGVFLWYSSCTSGKAVASTKVESLADRVADEAMEYI